MRNNKNNITLSLRNIISFLKILIGYFTGKEKIITLCLVILMLSSVNIIFNITNISALSYQSPVGISFTFNPTLSINISSDLVINSLLPGSSSNSNTVNVAVATNTAYGYILSASVNSGYLTHSNNIDTFSSIGTNASYSNLEDFSTNADTNTWGYSYKDNSVLSSTWSNYSGLATETNKVLLDTNEAANNSSADFKIAAKASSTQASGTYTGTIVFAAVAKPRPKVITDLEYLQDFADLDEVNLASVKSSMPVHSTFTLKDKRDEQEYTIAKLADGKIWMTKNLNLAGGTTLTSDTTDFDSTYTIPETQGWQANNTLPTSDTSGFSIDNYAYVYNSDNEICSDNSPCYSYYSWDAATLGSGRNIHTNNYDSPHSICPKGWHLPSTYDGTNSSTDFRALIIAYGGSNNIQEYNRRTSPTGAIIYNNVGPHNIAGPNFQLNGEKTNNSSYNTGVVGRYWSSTSTASSSIAMNFYLTSSDVGSSQPIFRRSGIAVRCLAR